MKSPNKYRPVFTTWTPLIGPLEQGKIQTNEYLACYNDHWNTLIKGTYIKRFKHILTLFFCFLLNIFCLLSSISIIYETKLLLSLNLILQVEETCLEYCGLKLPSKPMGMYAKTGGTTYKLANQMVHVPSEQG